MTWDISFCIKSVYHILLDGEELLKEATVHELVNFVQNQIARLAEVNL